MSIDFNPPALEDGSRIDLPVIVMAGNRPHYLYRMLKTLRGVQGLNPSMVTVFIDGFLDEPASVTRVFGLRAEQHASVSSKNSRICQVINKIITLLQTEPEGCSGTCWFEVEAVLSEHS